MFKEELVQEIEPDPAALLAETLNIGLLKNNESRE